MSEALVILQSWIGDQDRAAVMHSATPIQSVSDHVFVIDPSDAPVVAKLRAMRGVAGVLTGAGSTPRVPTLDEAESLFVQAWLSRQGQAKQRRGEGSDWDTPPMLPPDPKR
jgi:hypothetical protein